MALLSCLTKLPLVTLSASTRIFVVFLVSGHLFRDKAPPPTYFKFLKSIYLNFLLYGKFCVTFKLTAWYSLTSFFFTKLKILNFYWVRGDLWICQVSGKTWSEPFGSRIFTGQSVITQVYLLSLDPIRLFTWLLAGQP